MYMFCKDSKPFGVEEMRRHFCIGPYRLKSQIILIYFLGKNPRNSLFSVVEFFEGKVLERRFFFSISNGYNSKTTKQNVWFIFLN